jgi:hypothetical protein
MKIIGFLFCTIALMFISAKILSPREGFQASGDSESEPNCYTNNIRGKTTWFCDSEMDGQERMRKLIDSNVLRDRVCYKTGIITDYYVCYTRPPDKQYIDSEGVFVPIDPSEDLVPGYTETDVENECNDFNTAFANFSTIRVSTLSLNGVISSAIGEVTYAVDKLRMISTTYCYKRPTGTPYPIGLQRACTTLETGRSNINNIPGRPNGLYFMSTTVQTSLSNMDNLYNGTFKPAFKGFNVCSNLTTYGFNA